MLDESHTEQKWPNLVSLLCCHRLGRAQGKCDLSMNMTEDPKVGSCAPQGRETEQGTSTNIRMGRVLRKGEEDAPSWKQRIEV